MTEMSSQVLVLQHSDGVGAGWLDDAFSEAGTDTVLVRLDAGEPVPDWVNWQGVVSLGGVMGAYDDTAHPFLVSEKRFLAKAVGRDTPVLGLCLGSQLLADALGGRAYKGSGSEAGLLSLTHTDAGRSDPVFRAFPDRVVVSHGDTFDLPPGAELLAYTDEYRHAFRFGSALAVQPHPEAGAEIVYEWVNRTESGNIAKAGIDPEVLMAEVRAAEESMKEQAVRFFVTWLGTL